MPISLTRLLSAGCLAAPLVADAAQPRMHTDYGLPSFLGEGTVTAFMWTNPNGKPKAIGVEISGDAFIDMPTAPSDGRWDIVDMDGNVVWHCCGHELSLDMPVSAAGTPFQHIVVNYNPQGHVPPGVYDLPHFDVHFYMIPEATRLSIGAPAAEDRCLVPGPGGVMEPVPLTCDDYQRAIAPVPSDTQPPDHVSVGAVEPAMGNHLLDLSSPEFTGGIFSHTWIFGTWDGALHFFEPMITTDFLLGLTGKQCFSYAMPEAMPARGMYPTKYCMRYDLSRDVYQITLERWRPFAATASALP